MASGQADNQCPCREQTQNVGGDQDSPEREPVDHRSGGEPHHRTGGECNQSEQASEAGRVSANYTIAAQDTTPPNA